MNPFKILPYKQGSKSAKALATELGCKVLKLEGSKYVPKSQHSIINWGNTQEYKKEYLSLDGFYNLPENVKLVSNKLSFFQLCDGAPWLPTFYTNKDEIEDEDFPIVCRTILNGHSGAGIVLADCRDDLVDAPLYVKYIKKKDEYRVHVGRRTEPEIDDTPEYVVVAAQRKARKLDVPDEEINWQIRNHKNGFVYVREGFTLPDKVREVAITAFRKTGLDFGAVDVVVTSKGVPYVLEINTAPGLEGQTVKDYANFFKGFV